MGEQIVLGESIVGKDAGDVSSTLDDLLSVHKNVVCLRSSCAENFKYVHNDAVGYNRCKFNPKLEVILNLERNEGRNIACLLKPSSLLF